jgi:hypothetical protein
MSARRAETINDFLRLKETLETPQFRKNDAKNNAR